MLTPTDAVKRLIEAGWSEAAIATRCGVSQTTIHRIKHGQNPRHQLGADLLKLARQFRRIQVQAAQATQATQAEA